MSHCKHWTPSDTVFWCSSQSPLEIAFDAPCMAAWQGFINAMQSPGKFAGFFETEAATMKPRIAAQACFTWSAHAVASFALRAAQAWTKGSKLFEQ